MYKFILLLVLPSVVFAQKQRQFTLFDLQLNGELTAINREAMAITQGDETYYQMYEGQGEGLVWLPIKDFENGTIEIEMRGKDLFQRSFIGVAFHGVNDSIYDAVYCRPFNFLATDSVRHIHAIQYISHPVFTWKKLRETRNAQFEKQIINPPYPNGWFTMRLEISATTIKAYINQDKNPALVVEKLSTTKKGKLGIFVGDGAGGDFRRIKISGQ
jgi:hypothetical protein